MLTRLDKVGDLKHSHNLKQVTFSNPSSTLLDTKLSLLMRSYGTKRYSLAK